MTVKGYIGPAVCGFAIDPPRPANETAARLSAHRHFCVPSAPFGDETKRMDAECFEVTSGDIFSLEVMPGWVRVYYGGWAPTPPGERDRREERCAEIQDGVKEVLA